MLVVASTVVNYDALRESGYIPHRDTLVEPKAEDSIEVWDAWADAILAEEYIDELHEAAGRGCYQSWPRPNPATASNAGYLGHILDVGHLSVMGHGHVTFYVEGVSRALLLELERHAEHMNINFSVVSQRYVDHSEAKFVIPPILEKHLDEPLYDPDVDWKWTVGDQLEAMMEEAQDGYRRLATFMERKGYKRKEIRGAVRAVLPENTETKFFVTGSVRAWIDIITKRLTDQADAEIRNFAREVLLQLKQKAPNSVQHLEVPNDVTGE